MVGTGLYLFLEQLDDLAEITTGTTLGEKDNGAFMTTTISG
jgi:hypothetical protein